MNMCEKCGVRYLPTSPVLDRGICRACASPQLGASEESPENGFVQDLTKLLLQQNESAHPPNATGQRARGDFFISYHSQSLEHAVRVDQLAHDMGKSTFFFRNAGGSGKFLKEFQDALERSDRIICILSRGYFESQYCRDELDAFWMLCDRDEERRIVFLEVEPSRIPRAYRKVRIHGLMNRKPEAYEAEVREAIESIGRKYAEYGQSHDERDEPWAASLASLVHLPRPGWSPAFAMAALCLMAIGYYLAYFQFGPRNVWDMREAATYAAVGRDISLPWSWTLATADLREYVSAGEQGAVDYWRRPNGRLSEFKSPGQFLQPIGLSMLKSTLPETGNIEEGIAQYRAVFAGGSIKLLADVQPDGDSYRGFRIENDANGALIASYFEKRPGGMEATLTRLAPVRLGTAYTLHDIGLSQKDGLLTLWHNRSVLATWPPRESRMPSWKRGAFGLAASGSSRVQLYRWSLSANRQEAPAVLGFGRRRATSPPELLSLLSR